MSFLKKLLGLGPGVDYDDLVKRGAVIVDVRSPGEYAGGHIRGSVNIPLNDLQRQLKRLPDKQKPIITCCASGARSASASNILRSQGYTEVINGGGWYSLSRKWPKKQ
jgi:phage shock protein E